MTNIQSKRIYCNCILCFCVWHICFVECTYSATPYFCINLIVLCMQCCKEPPTKRISNVIFLLSMTAIFRKDKNDSMTSINLVPCTARSSATVVYIMLCLLLKSPENQITKIGCPIIRFVRLNPCSHCPMGASQFYAGMEHIFFVR